MRRGVALIALLLVAQGARGETSGPEPTEQHVQPQDAAVAEAPPAPEKAPDPPPGALPEIEIGDQVRVKGERLEGRVVDLGEEHLVFDPEYGEGRIKIKYKDIQALLTQREFHVFYSEGGQVTGRLLGVEEGVLLVGDIYERAYRVPLDEIEKGVAAEEYDDSLLKRLRVRYRYWNANFDLGFAFEEGAVDKRKIDIALAWQRRKLPTRWTNRFEYRFEVQQKLGSDPVTTKDEFLGGTAFEYELGSRLSLWDRQFVTFVLAGVEQDKPRAIDIRVYPGAGLGWRFLDSEKYFLQPSLGFGFVYEKFVGFPDNIYPAAIIALEARVALPFGSELDGWLQAWPGLTDTGNNWLFRWNLGLTVPIYDPLAIKFRISDVADNNPSQAVGNNKFVTSLGISFVF